MKGKRKNYKCDICNYYTDRLTDYKRHMESNRHKKEILSTNAVVDKKEIYECECGKQYKFRSGLSRHRPICSVYLSTVFDNENMKESTIYENEFYELNNDKITEISKNANLLTSKNDQKSEKTTLQSINNIMENGNKIKNIEKSDETTQCELKGLLGDIAQQLKELKDYKETHQQQVTNNNYVLNLNMFLNENCKNAISLEDFVNQITFVFDDLKDRSWRSKILLNNLDSLQLENRPFHCVDSETKQVVMKNGSKWQKGSTDDIVSTLDSCGKHIQKQFGPKWESQYPEWTNSEKYSRQYMNLWCNISKEPSLSQLQEEVRIVTNETELKTPQFKQNQLKI